MHELSLGDAVVKDAGRCSACLNKQNKLRRGSAEVITDHYYYSQHTRT